MNRILIIGPGGIGSALANLASSNQIIVDIAGRKKPHFDYDTFIPFNPLTNDTFIDVADHIARKQIEMVINTIGILYDENHSPEKSVCHVNKEWFLQSMQVNCLGTINLLKLLTNILPKDNNLKFIALSARVGSIEDNRLGGWMSYRASKAALNMGIRSVAIEWKRKFKNACIVGYHPGTVNTKLSKPFQANVKQLFSPEQAALYLYQFSQTVTPDMSGNVYDWQQERIPF